MTCDTVIEFPEPVRFVFAVPVVFFFLVAEALFFVDLPATFLVAFLRVVGFFLLAVPLAMVQFPFGNQQQGWSN